MRHPDAPLPPAPRFAWADLLAQWVPDDPWQPEPQTPQCYETKARIAAWLQPDYVVEIGVRAGYSALAFHMGHAFTRYDGIDRDLGTWGGIRGYTEHATQLLARLPGVSHSITHTDTQELDDFDRWPNAGLFHVDGDHSFGGALHDIVSALDAGARFVVVDDYDFIPDVRRAADLAVQDRGLAAWYAGDGGYRGNLIIANVGVVPPGVAAPSAPHATPGFNTVVPARYGPMLVNINDQWLCRSFLEYGEFSELEIAFLRPLLPPDAVIIDAGANFGALTVPLAQHAARGAVFAFEPQRLVFQALCGNVALNSLTNVVTFNSALGAVPGSVRVPLLDPNAHNSFGSLRLDQGTTDGQEVPVVAIDQLGLSRLDLLKADVEGWEPAVLRGAYDTIERCRPLLYVESDQQDKREELFAVLRELEYRAWWHCPPLFQPDNPRGRTDNIFVAGGRPIVSLNLICAPRDEPRPDFAHLEPAFS